MSIKPAIQQHSDEFRQIRQHLCCAEKLFASETYELVENPL